MTITREELESGRVDFSDIDEPGAAPIGPIHPAEFLKEWLKDRGLNARDLAQNLRVPASRIEAILAERGGFTADLALRLSRFFGTSPVYWMNLQSHYELDLARMRLKNRLSAVQPHAA
jgi:addiction module HigA family antidote